MGFKMGFAEVAEIYITECCSFEIPLQSQEVQGRDNGKHAL